MTRHVAVFTFRDFQLLDLSGPIAALHTARQLVPGAYCLHVVSEQGGPIASSSGVEVTTQPIGPGPLDTLVLPGGHGIHACAASPASIAAVATLAAQTRRTVSVCTGAFLLAACGLLDGRRATTHWRFATRLQAAHPAIRVEPERIFINDGPVWTSAGVTAGIDLTLAMIEADLGPAIAKRVAQEMVVYYRRPGGQSQFSALLELEPDSARIRQAVNFARNHLAEHLPVERLAEAARLSPRQFGRAFAAETGQTPAKAVERMRVETARPMVEDGTEPLEAIARAVGFTDLERMRRSFVRVFGQTPQSLRRTARAQTSDA